MTITLVSNDGNHPAEHWSHATAQTIFDLSHLTNGRLIAAHELQQQIEAVLREIYQQVIDQEITNLATVKNHSTTGYDVLDQAKLAVSQIALIANESPWHELIYSADWQASAINTVANHLASAIHVERLLFADSHPNDASAVAYKTRFTG